MARVNRALALAFVALALLLHGRAGEFPDTAGLFPQAVLIAIVALSGLLFARSFLVAPAAWTNAGSDPLERAAPYLVFAAMVGAVLLMGVVGFFPALVLFGGVLMAILRVERPLLYAPGGLATLGFVYLVFVRLLNVPLTSSVFFHG